MEIGIVGGIVFCVMLCSLRSVWFCQ